jgi:Family of unknown function (DUF5754)
MFTLVRIETSDKPGKKLTATFVDDHSKRTKKVHFGAAGMGDFTLHRDPDRKSRYLKRHRANENWNDPLTAGALSRWILWNKPTLNASIQDYRNRFFKRK